MDLLKSMLPQAIYLHFEKVSLEEKTDRLEMRLGEKTELVPLAMEKISNVVLDGFCHPLE